jgi:hypothetical protein
MDFETNSIQVFRGPITDARIDIPSIMRRAGYEAGIRAASAVVVKASKEAYLIYKDPKSVLGCFYRDFGANIYEFQNKARDLARLGAEIRKLLK